MRTLAKPPLAVFDRDVAIGSFAGHLPRVDWSPAQKAQRKGPLFGALHDKRWIYVGVREGSLFLGAAVVRTGYASNALVWAWDSEERGLLDERVALGSVAAASVDDDGPGTRRARFEGGGLRVAIDERAIAIDAPRGASIGPGARSPRARPTEPLHVHLDVSAATAPPIGAICRISGGLASATQKHLATASGEVVVGGARRRVASAHVAFDYTSGLLARHTAWRWALALGTAADGTRVGLNLVQGFVGEPECALWVGDRIEPLGEGIVGLDVDDPMRPWTIATTCGAVDLAFHPGAMHAQRRDLVLIKSRFLQPAGRFTGTIRSRGVELEGLDLLGVAEDQDLVW